MTQKALTGRAGMAIESPSSARVALRNVVSTRSKFTVLIGSRARRTDDECSDIDVVRIAHKNPIKENVGANQRVSYIDYDMQTFLRLYERGELFLYHVFREGRLLDGNAWTWEWLKEHFRVSTNFRREISRNRRFLTWLQRGMKYNGAVVPYLAHTCRALKNLAIFSLAEKRKYIFDKRKALREAFPRLSSEAITLLVDANNSFERVPWRPLSRRTINCGTIKRLNREIATAANLPEPDASG